MQLVSAIFVGTIVLSAPIGLFTYALFVIGRVIGGKAGLTIAAALGIALGTVPLVGAIIWCLWSFARFDDMGAELMTGALLSLGTASFIAIGVAGTFFFGWLKQRLLVRERAA